MNARPLAALGFLLTAAPCLAADASRLSKRQAELSLAAEELETLRAVDPASVLPDPALRPFFKDPDRALDALYRTLAVFDYGRAARDKNAACAPVERRHALIAVRDGLFAESDGAPSPWLKSLLGEGAGRTVGPATKRPAGRIADEREYELLRLRLRRLSRAADSGAGGARLYCERAAVFEALARARSAGVGGRAAAKTLDAAADATVLIGARDGESLRVRGAGVLVRGPNGARILTDASLLDGTTVLARTRGGTEAALVVERRSGGVALAKAEGLEKAAALALADAAPAPGALVGAVGHLRAAGSWTRTRGLVTAASGGAFRTDAAVSPDMRGGPVVDSRGRLAGVLVGSKDGAPVAVDAPALAKLVSGASAEDAAAPTVPGYAQGTASILTEVGLPSNSGGVCWDGGCGGGLPNARPSGNYGRPSGGTAAPAPDMAPMMGLMAQALGGLIGNMLTQPPPRPQGTRFFGQTVSPGPADETAPDKGRAKPKPELVGVDLTVEPSDAKPGDTVTLIATLVMYDAANSGEPYSRAGYEVTFDADPPGSLEIAWPTAKTDDGGHASVTARVAPAYAGEPKSASGLVATGLELPGGLVPAGAGTASAAGSVLTAIARVVGLTGMRPLHIFDDKKDALKNPCGEGYRPVDKSGAAAGAAPEPDNPTPPTTGPGGSVQKRPYCASDEGQCEIAFAKHAVAQFDCKNAVRRGHIPFCAADGDAHPDINGGNPSTGGQASPPSGYFAKGADGSEVHCVPNDGVNTEETQAGPQGDDKSFAKAESSEGSTPEEVLMPGGNPVGEEGTKPSIREMSGGFEAAKAFFEKLTKGGNSYMPDGYKGVAGAKVGEGWVGLRTEMSNSPNTAATIDVNIPGIPISKIKFNP